MVYCIQANVFFRNVTRRNAVLGTINTRFGSSAQYGTPVAEAVTNRAGEPGIDVVARFANQADRDALWAELDSAFGTGINGPVTGSRAWVHDCPHDEGAGACVIGNQRTW